MQVTATYESPIVVQNESAVPIPTTLSVTETELFKCTDQKFLHKSQLTIMASVTLGGVASATFYYYVSPDGTNWFPISLYNTSTGEITQRAVLVDSGTYATGGKSMFADNVPMPAMYAFRVTGKSASGTPAFTLAVVSRDN